MINFNQVTKVYQVQKGDYIPVKALDRLSLEIRDKEFVVLVGDSGAGKSTMLKLLHCQEVPTAGEVVVGGINTAELARQDVPKLRRKVGYIFQDFKLLPQKTVAQNIAFALEIIGSSSAQIRYIVPKAIAMIGLKGKEYSLPSELSSGEMQRVAIARSLVYQPKVLLADEPTGNLDNDNTWKVIELLLKINQMGTTVILATHNQEVVNNLRKRTIALQGGKIISDKINTDNDNDNA